LTIYIIRVSGAPPVIYSSQSRAKLVFLIEARPEPEVATRFQPGQPVDVSLVKPEHCLTETELVIDVRMLCGLLLPDAGRRRLETTFGIGKLHLA